MKKHTDAVVRLTDMLCDAKFGLSAHTLGLLLGDFPKIFERQKAGRIKLKAPGCGKARATLRQP